MTKYYAHAQGFSKNNRIDEPILFYQLLFSRDHNDNRFVEYDFDDSESEVIERFEKKYPGTKIVYEELFDGKHKWNGYRVYGIID